MMNKGYCEYRLFTESEITTYRCYEIKKMKCEILLNFRANNATDKIEKAGIVDKAYEEFKKEIERICENCGCTERNMKFIHDATKKWVVK